MFTKSNSGNEATDSKLKMLVKAGLEKKSLEAERNYLAQNLGHGLKLILRWLRSKRASFSDSITSKASSNCGVLK